MKFLTPPPLRVRGVSLVELMVGIVVAMAAVLAVTQVFRVSEGQRRTTAGTDDAQTTGVVAMSLLQRDLRQAGQGLMSPRLLDCKLRLGGSTHDVPSVGPVLINPANIAGAEVGTDVLLVSYGSGWSSPEGGLIALQTNPTTYAVPGSRGYQSNDRVIVTKASRDTNCDLTLTRIAGTPTNSSISVQTGVADAANGVVFNLGSAPRFIAYAIRNGRLTACDVATQDCNNVENDNWTEIADNIVGLRAQYALDTSSPRDGLVDSYDSALPAVSGSTPSTCAWARVVGVRVVLVARSRQAEKEDVAASEPTWSGAASSPITPTGADWKRYRYRTFETTVPLRNAAGPTDPMFTSCI